MYAIRSYYVRNCIVRTNFYTLPAPCALWRVYIRNNFYWWHKFLITLFFIQHLISLRVKITGSCPVILLLIIIASKNKLKDKKFRQSIFFYFYKYDNSDYCIKITPERYPGVISTHRLLHLLNNQHSDINSSKIHSSFV